MWSIVIAALILIAPFGYVRWQRSQTSRIQMADAVWGDVEYHASTLLEDRTLNPILGDLIENLLSHIGTGRLTRRFLMSFWKRQTWAEDEIDRAFRETSPGQHSQLLRFMLLMLFYDSLRAGIAGIILRKFVMYWLYATASDKKAIVTDAQVEPILKVAERECCPA